MLTKILSWLGLSDKINQKKTQAPIIIPRSQHGISRANISKHALKVLYRLREAGYQAYLVGGGVRDALLDCHPKDFDVATDARPEQVQKLFQNCRLIGRRFRLAHIHFGGHIVEVATFRASSSNNEAQNPHLVHSEEGMILRDNVYGTIEEDVFRRDFTINALYYNIADFSLFDYTGGLRDLKSRYLRMIGNAKQRYREDPVRMLRAVRFAAKLDFKIVKDTEAPIFELGCLVKQVPSARLLDEYTKLFLSGFAKKSFELLRHYKLFGVLFPETDACLNTQNNDRIEAFIKGALSDTDKRVADHKPVALPFLVAAFLWPPLQNQITQLMSEGMTELNAFYEACDQVLHQQQETIAIPRRLIQAIREIWVLQIRLNRRIGKRLVQLYTHPRFRAAYDFLILRAATEGKAVQEIAEWWKNYINADEETKSEMAKHPKREIPRYRRKRKKQV